MSNFDRPRPDPPAQNPPDPWQFLEGRLRPPLLQALAPHLPPDKGIQHLQHERQQWRQAWAPYAESLKDLIGKMLRDERNRQGDAVQITALEGTLRSIEDDIYDVLSANPDLNNANGTRDLLRANRPRTTPSYFAYSAIVLQHRLESLQNMLGHGENPYWPSGPHSTRVYGQDYPGDEFREILHYKPAKEKPTGWRLRWAGISSFLPTTLPPEVHFWFRVQVVELLLWVLFVVLSSVIAGRYRSSECICGSSVRDGTSEGAASKVVANVVYHVSGTMKQVSLQGVSE